MQQKELREIVLGIFRNALFALLVVAGSLLAAGYFLKWSLEGAQAWERYGNVSFFAGIALLIVGGFLVGGVRQMPMGQGAFIHMQSIGTEAELDNSARSRFIGLAAFFYTYRATISLWLAGALMVIIGMIMQNLTF
ncbi:MAG: hypothetical protein ACOYYS_02855 [Chloroflexota bacterium]